MNPSEPEHPTELTGASLAVVQSFKNAYRSHDRRKGRETHRLGGSEISQAQFELLVELKKNGARAVGELAQSMGLSPASVSQMVDRLSDQGHVDRVRSEEDRRVVRVDLSERGETAIEPIVERWRRTWKEALADFSDDDLEAASRVLDRIADLYDDRQETSQMVRDEV